MCAQGTCNLVEEAKSSKIQKIVMMSALPVDEPISVSHPGLATKLCLANVESCI